MDAPVFVDDAAAAAAAQTKPPTGAVLQKCPGDGSCMFHAVAAAMNGYLASAGGPTSAYLRDLWSQALQVELPATHVHLRLAAFKPYVCQNPLTDKQLKRIAEEAGASARASDPFVDVLLSSADPSRLTILQRIMLFSAGMKATTWGDSFTLDNLCRLLRIAAVVVSTTWDASTRSNRQSHFVLNSDTQDAGTEPPVAVCFLHLSVNHYDVFTWSTAEGQQLFMAELLASKRKDVPPELADKVPAHLWAASVEGLLDSGLPADPLVAHFQRCGGALSALQSMSTEFGHAGAAAAQEAAAGGHPDALDTPKHPFLGGACALPPQPPASVVALQCGVVVPPFWKVVQLAESAALGPGTGAVRAGDQHGPTVLRGGGGEALCTGFGAVSSR